MPTQNQLDARLNPTQVNYTLPSGQGFFRGANDPTSLFKYESNGGFTPFSLANFGRDQLGATGNAQAQSNAAIQHLKEQYGLDFNSLPEVNMGDLQQQLGARNIQGNQQFAGDLTSFLGATPKVAPTASQTENQPLPAGTAGAKPATPEQIAEQQKNPDFLGNRVASSGATPATQPNAQKLPANGSIVDFLNAKGQPSDFAARAKLAQDAGIKGYVGTATQNTLLLNTLSQTPASGSAPATNPSGKVGESGTLGTSTVQGTTGTGTSPVDKYANLDPIQKQIQMYTDSYKALGLSTIKDQFDTFTKQLGEVQKEMQDKIGKVQANPWLSQGIANRTVERIQKDYASRIDMLTHLQTLTDSMYKTGLAQVDHLVSNANADIRATNELAQKQLDAAQALAKDNQVASVGGHEVLVNKITGKIVADLGPTTHFATNSGVGLSADAQVLLAQSFLNTGQLPGLGIGGSATKTAILNQAGQLAKNQGLSGNDLSLQQANFKANSAALGKITTQKNLVLAFEKTANDNLAIVDQLANRTTAGNIPVINKWIQAGRTGIAGNADVSKYNAAIQTAVNEYAKVVSSVTGGQVTSDSARHEVMGLLNNAQTAQQVHSVIQLMQTDMKNRENGYNSQITDLKSQLLNRPINNTSSAGGSTYNGITLPH